MNTIIKFAKTMPQATIPKKREEDAGYDLYTCFEPDTHKITLLPHQTVLLHTGIASVCSPDYCFIIKERSSTGSRGLAVRAGVIDSGYRGEWLVALTNENDYNYILVDETGEKLYSENETHIYPIRKAIAQVLLIPVPQSDIEVIEYDQLLEYVSERGINALGSTNV